MPQSTKPPVLVDLKSTSRAAFSRCYLCLGAPPLLYPAAPPSVFDYYIVKYTAPAVALGREYVVGFLGLYGRNTIIILKFANHFVNDYVVGISISVCSIAGTI